MIGIDVAIFVHDSNLYRLKVFLGGGRNQFVPTGTRNSSKGGLRNDKRNLIDEWLVQRSLTGKPFFVDDKVDQFESKH